MKLRGNDVSCGDQKMRMEAVKLARLTKYFLFAGDQNKKKQPSSPSNLHVKRDPYLDVDDVAGEIGEEGEGGGERGDEGGESSVTERVGHPIRHRLRKGI